MGLMPKTQTVSLAHDCIKTCNAAGRQPFWNHSLACRTLAVNLEESDFGMGIFEALIRRLCREAAADVATIMVATLEARKERSR